MKPAARRLAALALGVLLAAASAEAALQIAAAFAKPQRAIRAGVADAREVVFCGDSHMYGIWVEDDETLPAVAESLSKELAPPGFHAANIGRAGAMSWVVLEDLRTYLEGRRPAAVIYRAGFNNLFTPLPEDAGWLDSFRLAKLLRLALANRNRPAASVPIESRPAHWFGIGPHREEQRKALTHEEKVKLIQQDVERFERPQPLKREIKDRLISDSVAVAQAAANVGAAVFFLTYLSNAAPFDEVNRSMEEAAEKAGATLVDLRTILDKARAAGRDSELLFGDGHPRRLGYGIEARALVDAMTSTGWLRGRRPEDPVDWYKKSRLQGPASSASASVSLTMERSKDSLRFQVSGAPDCEGWLLIGRAADDWILLGLRIPISKADATAIGNDPATRFKTDARGFAEASLQIGPIERLGAGVRVAALLFERTAAGQRIGVSPVVDLETGSPLPVRIEPVPEALEPDGANRIPQDHSGK